MNIVALEGRINGLNKAKESHKGTDLYFQYDQLIFSIQVQLTDVTGNLKPENLIKELVKLSR